MFNSAAEINMASFSPVDRNRGRRASLAGKRAKIRGVAGRAGSSNGAAPRQKRRCVSLCVKHVVYAKRLRTEVEGSCRPSTQQQRSGSEAEEEVCDWSV